LFLNGLVAVAAICVWLWNGHGIRGLLFLGPLAALAFACAILIRRNRRRSAFALVSMYVGCWAMTAICGVIAAHDDFQSRLNHPEEIHFLKTDPGPGNGNPDQPWCFVGNYSVPCPFIVSLDYSCMAGGFGVGGRIYFAWIPSGTWIVDDDVYWNSCPRR
jgi:hypothetical protein